MLDLKTIKEIKISEGSVTKITDSSGVVLWQKVVAPSASLDVDLNNQWIASTKTLDGYNVYMSNSNHNVDNGYASMKFKFKGKPDFKIWINSYAESNYDYTIAWNLDKDYPTSNPDYGSTGVKAHTQGKQYNPANGLTAFTEVDYSNDGGEHFVVVTYRKDSSVNNDDDRGYVAIKLTSLSTTWVISSTEFIKKDNKYYQRINEVGTYEGGVTALTGNYKEGNELTVTYKQGSADDYILVGSSMYYKKYAYVTPVNTEINTGDYIHGDYIGEAIPAMKVTYVDGTEKTFYNLTSIDRDTDPNKTNAKNVEVYDGVTSIGEYTFYGCIQLTSVTIPDSVTSIGKYAFQYCSSLTGITIPDSVSSIGEWAFNGCKSLTSITIPDSVISIGDGAFNGCSSLSSITIPNSVTSIGDNAFGDCSSLTGITIPDSVTSIGYYAFGDCSSLTGITLSDNLTSIGSNAFYNCSSLTSITIPNSITSISRSAFENCSKLTDITIPSGVTSIGEWAFSGCKSLTSITIPDSVISIGDGAFNQCLSLTDITIPNSVTSIGEYSFYDCSNLTGITIPDSVTSIGNYAFENCSKLESVTIQNSSSKLAYNTDAFANIPSTAKLYVPSNLLSDYQSDTSWTGAFGGGIFAITPSMKVTYTDNTEKAFYNLTSIDRDTVSNKSNVKEVEIYDSVTNIDVSAFYNCANLTGVTIQNSVTSIGDYAFYDCAKLTGVTIPDSVKTIGNYAFEGCLGLTSVTIGNGVTSIGNYAFEGCEKLTSVTIPNSVTEIGNDAFSECTGLNNVTIGNSVTSIGNYAFSSDDGHLKYITVQATTPPSLGIYAIPSDVTTIYVPTSSVNSYKSATDWSDYVSKIKAIGS